MHRELAAAVARLRTSGRFSPVARAFLILPFWFVLSGVAVVASLPITASQAASPGRFLLTIGIAQALATLVAVWGFRRLLDRASLVSLGLLPASLWREALLGALVGSAAILFVVGVLWLLGAVAFSPAPAIVPLTLAGVLVGATLLAFHEELLVRGYILQNLAAGWGFAAAVAISSALFAVLHAFNPNTSAVAFVNLALSGVLFALLYVLTGSLVAPTVAHAAWNLVQGAVFGLPVSGVDYFARAALLNARVKPPDWLSGGAFGPEASVITLATLAAIDGVLLALIRRRWKQDHGGERQRDAAGDEGRT
ncbi:MAG TPA: type II CAAX endopeptidase family protein [Chloroflexota bacterium]